MKELEKYKEDMEAIKAEMVKKQEELKTSIIANLQKIIKEREDLIAIRIVGYTPSFNDGDPCTFTVGEFGYKFKDTEEEGEEQEWGGWDDCYMFYESSQNGAGDYIKIPKGERGEFVYL